MVFALAMLIVLPQEPKPALPTMLEIRQGMHAASRKLTGYSDEWEVTLPPPEGEEAQPLTFFRWINGKENKWQIDVVNDTAVKMGSDGKNTWAIIFPEKAYFTAPHEGAFDEKPPTDAPTGEDGSFKYTFNSYEVSVGSVPDLVVVKDELVKLDEVEVRKIDAEIFKSPQRYVKAQMWFDKSRWLPLKFDVNGKDEKGKEFKLSMVQKKRSFNTAFGPGFFNLPESEIVGFQKREGGG